MTATNIPTKPQDLENSYILKLVTKTTCCVFSLLQHYMFHVPTQTNHDEALLLPLSLLIISFFLRPCIPE